ncbi:MAG: type II secretion system protein, partial [Planctomycetes bacterium]|nr:type II secretion system protein [Planctomycetota bacterium]
MRKSFEIKELRKFPIRMTRQTPAFSLVELIVSMGILMLMLALAGQVMSLTVRSTGQAKALTEISQALRILETTLREDLRYVKAGENLLLIQGNPIDAYWSTAGKEADNNALPGDGFPLRDEKPRADILMFFTSRQASNYVKYNYPLTPAMSGKAVTSGVQQVVYGHANLVDLDANGNIHGTYPADYITFPEDDLTPYPVPADEWHLARRV